MNTQAIEFLESITGQYDSTITRDIKLNLKKIYEGEVLAVEDTNLLNLAMARSLRFNALEEFSANELEKNGMSAEGVKEARESAAIMGMLNTYYKFRTFMSKNVTPEEMEPYKMARLRMTSLAKPVLGKEKFETLAFGVSVLNGCESCVVSHEKALRDLGVSADKIHEVARLAANLKALHTLLD